MSSADEFESNTAGPSNPHRNDTKKKRLQGSCDACSRRKTRCDSANMPDNVCTNCRLAGVICAHRRPVKKRGPKNNYVASLERRVYQLEEMLKELQPDGKMPAASPDSQNSAASPASSSKRGWTPPAPPPLVEESNSEPEEAPEDLAYVDLMKQIKRLSLSQIEESYFGPSSNLFFMRKVMVMKAEIFGKFSQSGFDSRNWAIHPWEIKPPNLDFDWPVASLFSHLLEKYFSNFHAYLPIISEPSFRASITSGLHTRSRAFASVVLLVLALASRYSDDPRVLLDGVTTASAGSRWYHQAATAKRSDFEHPHLHDVQYEVLLAEYLLSTSVPQFAWIHVGNAIRYAVALGYHRYHPQATSAESEIKCRTFWCAYIVDRHTSFFHGRPHNLRDEEFDVGLPLPVDEEYFDTEPPFHQPPEVPSRIDYLLQHIKLCQIMGCAQRSIFAIQRAKQAAGLVGQCAEKNLAVLDSRLNKWLSSVPAHLRWENQREGGPFFHSSAILYGTFYHIQMQIHRPFITPDCSFSPAAMAACTTAARSGINLLETRYRVFPVLNFHMAMMGFGAGMIRCIDLWKKRKAGQSDATSRELDDIKRILEVFKRTVNRYDIAIRLINILQVLADITPEETGPMITTAPSSVGRCDPSTEAYDNAMSFQFMPMEDVHEFNYYRADADMQFTGAPMGMSTATTSSLGGALGPVDAAQMHIPEGWPMMPMDFSWQQAMGWLPDEMMNTPALGGIMGMGAAMGGDGTVMQNVR